MKNGFIPGPYEIERAKRPQDGEFDYGILAVIDGRKQVIAEAFGRTGEFTRVHAYGTARLLATAPDLLGFAKVMQDFMTRDDDLAALKANLNKLTTIVNSMIKKAGGES